MGSVSLNILTKSEITGSITDLTDSAIDEITANLTRIRRATAEILRLETTTIGENPFLSIYENSIRKGIIQYSAVNVDMTMGTSYGDLILESGTAGTPSAGIKQLASGAVGIGNVLPAFKLDVAGTIHADTDMVADGNMTATDVFATG